METCLTEKSQASTDELVCINVGCGHKKMKGFINVDLPGNWSGEKPDVEADIRKLPFADDYADELHAIHVIEHFYTWEVSGILQEWKRVLKPGGIIVLEMPCLEKVIQHFQKEHPSISKTMWALYGSPLHKNEAMCHRWCYSMGMIQEVMEQSGFANIRHETPQWHFADRDMRVTARKSK